MLEGFTGSRIRQLDLPLAITQGEGGGGIGLSSSPQAYTASLPACPLYVFISLYVPGQLRPLCLWL